MSRRLLSVVLALALLPTWPLSGAELSGPDLIAALRAGGYNIYFRHAATDWSDGDRVEGLGDWTSCEREKMRQLSDEGRQSARAVGAAMRALGIPVAAVLSSEYCRAAETARLLGLGPVTTTRDIMNMRAADYLGGPAAVARRARGVLSQPPPVGANVVIVGHGNVIRAATGFYPDEGGSGVFRPGTASDGSAELVGWLSPAEWIRLGKVRK